MAQRKTPAAEGLLYKAAKFRLKNVEDGGVFEGYGSTYRNVDKYGDVIEPGAFAKTLGDSPQRPLLWGHDPREPIGIADIKDDERGLFVQGRLALDVQRAREAHALLKMGAVRGMSIGFFPRKWEPLDKGGRKFTEIELVEVSLTAFPANPQAVVDAVRQAEMDAEEAAADSMDPAANGKTEPDDVRSEETQALIALLIDTEFRKWRVK